MISAMYENGGNTTHRLLDGHPQMYVYPFESQLGTAAVRDHWASLYPLKYRWPQFALDADLAADFRSIIDEETRVRTRTPNVSKFRDWAFDMDDDERMALCVAEMEGLERRRPEIVAAFFRATFNAWKDLNRSGRESTYVGYSPVIGVDAETILAELPQAHVLQVVRNPWSAFAETRRRPVPLRLAHYLAGWVTVQQATLVARELYPDRVHILRYEDIVADPQGVLGEVCAKLGLEAADSLATPSWNGAPLAQVYPWGTIREPSTDANRRTGEELSAAERDEVTRLAGPYLEKFDYR
jgi:hypothetical protein